MSLITPEDLITELYPEVIEQITRTNREEQITQIKAAEDFAKGFLFKYDLKALFGDNKANPSVHDEGLRKCIKIIAAYFLVRKSNPNVSLELFREDYMMMIGTKEEPGWLYEIRNGEINPDWPYKPDDISTEENESEEHDQVFWHSTTKRTQRF